MNISNYTNKYRWLLIILMTFHLITNSWWIKINKNPLDFDPIGHTFATINSAKYVRDHLANFSLKDYMKISPGYPNFVETATLPLIFFFGNHWKVIQFSGTLFFLLAIWAIFLYVKEISQNEKIAFLSSFFYSFFITIVQYSRFQMLDIPLTAMIMLTLFFWERLKKTNNISYWYASVLTVAFAQTSKWHAGIFLFIPFIFFIVQLFKKNFFQGKRLLHFLIGCLISMVIIFPWFYYNWADFIRLGTINYLGEADDPKNFLSLTTLFFYLKLIIQFQTHFIGFMLLVISLLTIHFSKKKYLLVPLLTIIFTYIFFTYLIPNKNIRVIFPIMPFIGLIMAEGTVSSKFLRVFGGVVGIYMVVAFFILSFGRPIQPNYRFTVQWPILDHLDLVYLKTYPVDLLPSRKKIDYNILIDTLLSYHKTGRPIKILVAVHQRYFNQGALMLEVYMKYRDNLDQAYRILTNNINLERVGVGQYLSDYDLIITSERKPIHPEETLNELYLPLKDTQNFLLTNQDQAFIKAEEFALPENDKLLLYRNKTSLSR